MPESKLFKQIAQKESDEEKIAARIIKRPELLSEIIEGLDSDKARIKYGCLKILRIISEKEPKVLYPRFDFFTGLLESDNTFFKWGAIYIISNLSSIDLQNKFEKIFDKYFAPVPGPYMISAANVIRGGAKIALAKPKLTERITREILKVEKGKYQTIECHNVVLGHAIKSFDQFFDQIKDKEQVMKLAKKQLNNTRNATRKAAEKFLNKRKD